jgi:hypothetical protein
VVLEVLGEVAEAARDTDRLDHLRAPWALEVRQLCFELGLLVGRQGRV